MRELDGEVEEVVRTFFESDNDPPSIIQLCQFVYEVVHKSTRVEIYDQGDLGPGVYAIDDVNEEAKTATFENRNGTKYELKLISEWSEFKQYASQKHNLILTAYSPYELQFMEGYAKKETFKFKNMKIRNEIGESHRSDISRTYFPKVSSPKDVNLRNFFMILAQSLLLNTKDSNWLNVQVKIFVQDNLLDHSYVKVKHFLNGFDTKYGDLEMLDSSETDQPFYNFLENLGRACANWMSVEPDDHYSDEVVINSHALAATAAASAFRDLIWANDMVMRYVRPTRVRAVSAEFCENNLTSADRQVYVQLRERQSDVNELKLYRSYRLFVTGAKGHIKELSEFFKMLFSAHSVELEGLARGEGDMQNKCRCREINIRNVDLREIDLTDLFEQMGRFSLTTCRRMSLRGCRLSYGCLGNLWDTRSEINYVALDVREVDISEEQFSQTEDQCVVTKLTLGDCAPCQYVANALALGGLRHLSVRNLLPANHMLYFKNVDEMSWERIPSAKRKLPSNCSVAWNGQSFTSSCTSLGEESVVQVAAHSVPFYAVSNEMKDKSSNVPLAKLRPVGEEDAAAKEEKTETEGWRAKTLRRLRRLPEDKSADMWRIVQSCSAYNMMDEWKFVGRENAVGGAYTGHQVAQEAYTKNDNIISVSSSSPHLIEYRGNFYIRYRSPLSRISKDFRERLYIDQMFSASEEKDIGLRWEKIEYDIESLDLEQFVCKELQDKLREKTKTRDSRAPVLTRKDFEGDMRRRMKELRQDHYVKVETLDQEPQYFRPIVEAVLEKTFLTNPDTQQLVELDAKPGDMNDMKRFRQFINSEKFQSKVMSSVRLCIDAVPKSEKKGTIIKVERSNIDYLSGMLYKYTDAVYEQIMSHKDAQNLKNSENLQYLSRVVLHVEETDRYLKPVIPSLTELCFAFTTIMGFQVYKIRESALRRCQFTMKEEWVTGIPDDACINIGYNSALYIGRQSAREIKREILGERKEEIVRRLGRYNTVPAHLISKDEFVTLNGMRHEGVFITIEAPKLAHKSLEEIVEDRFLSSDEKIRITDIAPGRVWFEELDAIRDRKYDEVKYASIIKRIERGYLYMDDDTSFEFDENAYLPVRDKRYITSGQVVFTNTYELEETVFENKYAAQASNFPREIEVKGTSSIDAVHIENCRMSDEDLKHVLRILGDSTLLSMDFTSNNLTNESLKIILDYLNNHGRYAKLLGLYKRLQYMRQNQDRIDPYRDVKLSNALERLLQHWTTFVSTSESQTVNISMRELKKELDGKIDEGEFAWIEKLLINEPYGYSKLHNLCLRDNDIFVAESSSAPYLSQLTHRVSSSLNLGTWKPEWIKERNKDKWKWTRTSEIDGIRLNLKGSEIARIQELVESDGATVDKIQVGNLRSKNYVVNKDGSIFAVRPLHEAQPETSHLTECFSMNDFATTVSNRLRQAQSAEDAGAKLDNIMKFMGRELTGLEKNCVFLKPVHPSRLEQGNMKQVDVNVGFETLESDWAKHRVPQKTPANDILRALNTKGFIKWQIHRKDREYENISICEDDSLLGRFREGNCKISHFEDWDAVEFQEGRRSTLVTKARTPPHIPTISKIASYDVLNPIQDGNFQKLSANQWRLLDACEDDKYYKFEEGEDLIKIIREEHDATLDIGTLNYTHVKARSHNYDFKPIIIKSGIIPLIPGIENATVTLLGYELAFGDMEFVGMNLIQDLSEVYYYSASVPYVPHISVKIDSDLNLELAARTFDSLSHKFKWIKHSIPEANSMSAYLHNVMAPRSVAVPSKDSDMYIVDIDACVAGDTAMIELEDFRGSLKKFSSPVVDSSTAFSYAGNVYRNMSTRGFSLTSLSFVGTQFTTLRLTEMFDILKDSSGLSELKIGYFNSGEFAAERAIGIFATSEQRDVFDIIKSNHDATIICRYGREAPSPLNKKFEDLLKYSNVDLIEEIKKIREESGGDASEFKSLVHWACQNAMLAQSIKRFLIENNSIKVLTMDGMAFTNEQHKEIAKGLGYNTSLTTFSMVDCKKLGDALCEFGDCFRDEGAKNMKVFGIGSRGEAIKNEDAVNLFDGLLESASLSVIRVTGLVPGDKIADCLLSRVCAAVQFTAQLKHLDLSDSNLKRDVTAAVHSVFKSDKEYHSSPIAEMSYDPKRLEMRDLSNALSHSRTLVTLKMCRCGLEFEHIIELLWGLHKLTRFKKLDVGQHDVTFSEFQWVKGIVHMRVKVSPYIT